MNVKHKSEVSTKLVLRSYIQSKQDKIALFHVKNYLDNLKDLAPTIQKL